MSVFRTYFSKNNTLIKDSEVNGSKNPVTEIVYGGMDGIISRFIFDFDFTGILERIQSGIINPNRIVRHTLKLNNVIRPTPEYEGRLSYDSNLRRASDFKLDLFNINEEWTEGLGYDLNIGQQFSDFAIEEPSNWFYRKRDPEYVPWSGDGAYITGVTEILGSQYFGSGSENVSIDITDYINDRLYELLQTGTTGTTLYGNSKGLGLKYDDEYEKQITEKINVVSFQTKYANTFYEPFVETEIEDLIKDDRNFFYQNKTNRLFLYPRYGNQPIKDADFSVQSVVIYDNEENVYDVITGDGITYMGNGIFSVEVYVDSDEYPDAIMFKDEWNVVVNGREKQHVDYFYLIDEEQYYDFGGVDPIEFDNYSFYFWGICDDEKIRAGDLIRIKLTVKELYANQNNNKPLDIEYRVFTNVGSDYELDVIPFTPVNRTKLTYEFNLDTFWLIPQDYYLQIRMRNGSYYRNKETIRFTVTSEGVK